MSNLKLSYQNIIDKTGIEDRPYQRDFLTNPIYQIPNKPIVLGAGTSSGKTIMAILKLIMFYKNRNNKNKQSLVIPAFHEILRDNFMEQLNEIEKMYGKLPFSYIEIKGKNTNVKIKEALKIGINVIICLPQTTFNNSLLFKNKIEWFYFDEAHYFYLNTMCQKMLKQIKPKFQLLMTGSVSKYNSMRNDYLIKYVCVNELHKLGLVSNPKIELIQSSYDLKNTDYRSVWGSLKQSKTSNSIKNTEALYSVAKEMVLTLKNKFPNLITNKYYGKRAVRIFGDIDKTIMICNSIPQAECFYHILYPELKGKVLISHSETDREDWDNFNKFKTDDTKLLIVVNQGRIGFSMKELFNIVDFSMSKDFEIIQQMFGRLLRVSEINPTKQKIYYKVSTTDLAKWYEYVMRCVMCLMHIDWYSTYKGDKNQFKFPRIVKQRQQTNNLKKPTNKSKANNFKISDEFPLDLNYVNYVEQNMQSEFATYAWWDLKDALNELYNREYISFEEARNIVWSFNLKNQNDWREFSKTIRKEYGIPSQPEIHYSKEWLSFQDWIGTNKGSNGKQFLSFEDAKKYVKKLKFKSRNDWSNWKTNRPSNIPSTPRNAYKDEWKGWGDFLGTGTMAPQNKNIMTLEQAKKWVKSKKVKTSTEFNNLWKDALLPDNMPKAGAGYYKVSWPSFLQNGNDKVDFLSFTKARKYVRTLSLSSQKEWNKYSKTERPNNIPSNPKNVYKNEWIGFDNWLGK
jgi:superfamily II DNA or RNA helicase